MSEALNNNSRAQIRIVQQGTRDLDITCPYCENGLFRVSHRRCNGQGCEECRGTGSVLFDENRAARRDYSPLELEDGTKVLATKCIQCKGTGTVTAMIPFFVKKLVFRTREQQEEVPRRNPNVLQFDDKHPATAMELAFAQAEAAKDGRTIHVSHTADTEEIEEMEMPPEMAEVECLEPSAIGG